MSKTTDFDMPFGKHKGEPVSDVPTDYLDWLIGQDWLKPGLRERIEAHLATRADWLRSSREVE